MSLSSEWLALALLPALGTLGDTHCMKIPLITIGILFLILALIGSGNERKRAIAIILLFHFWRNLHLFVGTLLEVQTYSIQTIKFCARAHFTVYTNESLLPERKTIFLCNYARDRFENLFPLFLPRDMVFMVSNDFAASTHIKNSIPVLVTHKKSFGYIRDRAREITQNRDLFCYCQKPLFIGNKNYGRLRKGIFSIAREIRVPITIIRIDPIQTFLLSIYKQDIHISIGPTLVLETPEDIPRAMRAAQLFFRA